MHETDKGWNSNAVVKINVGPVSLNNKNGKKTTANTTEDPWVPDEAKREYHAQRLTQSKWSFWLSIAGGIIGFCVLIWSIRYGVVNDNPEWGGIVSGVVIEAVSALFYTLSNNANEKISEFFEELTKDSNVKEALKLSDNIDNTEIKDQLKVKLALHLVGINGEKICKNTNEICKKRAEED